MFFFFSAFQLVLVSVSDLLLAYCHLEISWVAWPSESSTAHSTSDMALSPCTHLSRMYHSPANTDTMDTSSTCPKNTSRLIAGWPPGYTACFI